MRFFLAGAAIAVGATFPLAALVALVFRFPIPFGSWDFAGHGTRAGPGLYVGQRA